MNTRSLGDETDLAPAIENAIAGIGSDSFNDGMLLRIEVDGGKEAVLIKPTQETVLGRRDPATGAMPDVDMTPFAGYRMGVSRRHAVIRHADGNRLDVWDLGSSNGTFLNGTRLNAHRPYKIHDGDEIRLGQMMMKVYFQHQPISADSPKPPSPQS